jgi:hypothetical protein
MMNARAEALAKKARLTPARPVPPLQVNALEATTAKDFDYRAFFIGDQAENGAIFKELLGQLVDDHLGWRKNYMPGDRAGIAVHDETAPEYGAAQVRLREVMTDLSQRLRSGSVPWNSAGRYWGHMNAETLMPAICVPMGRSPTWRACGTHDPSSPYR